MTTCDRVGMLPVKQQLQHSCFEEEFCFENFHEVIFFKSKLFSNARQSLHAFLLVCPWPGSIHISCLWTLGFILGYLWSVNLSKNTLYGEWISSPSHSSAPCTLGHTEMRNPHTRYFNSLCFCENIFRVLLFGPTQRSQIPDFVAQICWAIFPCGCHDYLEVFGKIKDEQGGWLLIHSLIQSAGGRTLPSHLSHKRALLAWAECGITYGQKCPHRPVWHAEATWISTTTNTSEETALFPAILRASWVVAQLNYSSRQHLNKKVIY